MLTNRVVKDGGGLADLPDGSAQQRSQLESEGVPFTTDGKVDFERIKPVRLSDEGTHVLEGSEEEFNARRAELELTELNQKILLEKWKVVLTAIGTMILLFGIFADRYRIVEERRIGREQMLRSARLERMTVIAGECDRLFGDTLTAPLQMIMERPVDQRAEVFRPASDGR